MRSTGLEGGRGVGDAAPTERTKAAQGGEEGVQAAEGKLLRDPIQQTWVIWDNHNASYRMGKHIGEGSVVGKLVISGFGGLNVK